MQLTYSKFLNEQSMTTPVKFLLQATIVVLSLAVLVHPISASDQTDISTRQQIVVTKAAVASDDGRCSDIGSVVMAKGGNAVDAAVATCLCLGVVGQGSSGIGGGSFMIVRMANGTAKAFDMREEAPGLASENMYDGKPEAKVSGGLSIGIPGELAGLYKAWTQFKSGNLPWKTLVEPAIKLARDGFEISKYVYSQFLVNPYAMINHTGLCQVYTRLGQQKCDQLDGKPVDDSYIQYLLNPGDIAKNPKLAITLTLISKHGPSVLYKGIVGARLVEDIRKAGGIITRNDLAEYKVVEREQLTAQVLPPPRHWYDSLIPQRRLSVITMPPPSSGGSCFILMLHILQYFGIPKGLDDPSGRYLYVESLKHVFGERENLGDPDFNPNVTKVVKDMLSLEFAEAIYRNISRNHTSDSARLYGSSWAPIPDDGTSHFSIIDEQENAVAMTTSVNNHFGSLILSPSTGILLNNVMDDFSYPNSSDNRPPAPSNLIQPKKRPLSSMTPTIVLQGGKLKAVIGASGGPFIIPAVTRVFLNHFGMGMKPLDSVLFPRVYDKLYPNTVYYENYTTVTGYHTEVPDKVLNYLKAKGNNLEPWTGEGAICQFVVRGNGFFGFWRKLTAVSDPRKGGRPAGFDQRV